MGHAHPTELERIAQIICQRKKTCMDVKSSTGVESSLAGVQNKRRTHLLGDSVAGPQTICKPPDLSTSDNMTGAPPGLGIQNVGSNSTKTGTKAKFQDVAGKTLCFLLTELCQPGYGFGAERPRSVRLGAA